MYFARFGTDERLQTAVPARRRRAPARLALELDNLVAACRRAVRTGTATTAVATLRAAWEAVVSQGPFDLVIDLGIRSTACSRSSRRCARRR